MTSAGTRWRTLARNQRSLFWAQLVESVGNFGLVTAFTLWATAASADAVRVAQLVSWVILANTVPRIVLAPAVAWVCSRVVEYRVLQGANLLRAIVCAAGLALGTRLPVAAVLTIATALGALDQFFPPARAAAAQRNLREDERAYFGALDFLALSGVGLLSSAITPAVYARGGLPAWLAIGLGCSMLSALIVQFGYRLGNDLVPRHDTATRPPGLWTGLRYAFTGDHAVALVTWSLIGYGLALGLTNQSMTPLAIQGLGISVAAYGWIPAAFAVGGLLAWFVTERASHRAGLVAVLISGALVLAVGYLAYGTATSLVVCVVAMLVAGLGFGLWSAVQGAILQGSVPNAMMATFVAGTAPLVPIASLLGSQGGRFLVSAADDLGRSPTLGHRASYLLAAAAVLLGAVMRVAAARGRQRD